MNNFLLYLKYSLKSQLSYHLNFLGQIFLLVFMYGMKLAFLSSLFQYTDALGDWTKSQAIFVLYVTLLISIATDIFDTSVFQFYRQVSLGTLHPHLLKPIPIYTLLLARWSKPASCLVLLIFLPFLFMFKEEFYSASAFSWLLFFLTFICGVICNLLLISLMNLSTFVVQRHLPVDYIYSEILRLCSFPLSVYPEKSLFTLMLLIPSLFCASAPAYVLLKGGDMLAFFFMLSTLLLFVIHRYCFEKMMKKHDGLGG